MRAFSPDVIIVGRFELELEIDVMIEIVASHGLDLLDLADIEAHKPNGVALFQAIGTIDESEIRGFGLEPPLSLGCGINVINETKRQEGRGKNDKQADRPVNP